MKVKLIYTDNEETPDLIDTEDDLILSEGRYEFGDLSFTVRKGNKTELGNGRIQFLSELGYTYLFKLL